MLLTFRHFALLLLPIIHIFCPLIRTVKDHLTKNFMKWSFYLSYILFFTQIIFLPFPHQTQPALHGQPQSDTVHLLLGALPPAPDHGFIGGVLCLCVDFHLVSLLSQFLFYLGYLSIQCVSLGVVGKTVVDVRGRRGIEKAG